MNDRLPWFPLYVADWLLDSHLQTLPLATHGAYIKLLCLAWWNDGIPSDPDAINKLLGEDQWTPQLAALWEPHPELPDRLHNPKLTEVATEQRLKRDKLVEAGRKGGLSQAQARPKPGSSNQSQNQNRSKLRTSTDGFSTLGKLLSGSLTEIESKSRANNGSE